MSSAASDLRALCDGLDSLLSGKARGEIVSSLLEGADRARALGRLRTTLRAQRLRTGDGTVELEATVRKLDHRTRREGFRVLHTWDHTTHRFTDDITPVLMLDHFARTAGEEASLETAVRILLDYYFLHLLALGAMRAWDDEDPDAVLDRVTELVRLLQGPGGSGHCFVDDAETLIIYAVSQFHPEEQAYDRLIEKARTLDEARQVRFASMSASVLSSHLRWGFWLMYERDVLRMRQDNVGDYPWLLVSVLTLARAWVARLGGTEEERRDVVDALLQGLAADPWAFIDKAPAALAEYAGDHAELRDLLERHGAALLEDLEAERPTRDRYSPLALHFNFPHNTLVALVDMALGAGEPQALPLNVLFSRRRAGPEAERLARALMAYSGSSPDRLGAHGAMLVAYDPLSAMRTFSMTTAAIREVAASE